MASAAVQFSVPSSSLFKFPPSQDPQTLLPPPPHSSVSAPPFSVASSFFSRSLDVNVPITIACVYAATVLSLNAYNKSRGNKPWAISKTRAFFYFVVIHNVFLAVYSGWTFVGMLGTLRRTIQNPTGPAGLAGTVDSLCKMHGASGLGNAIAYSPSSSAWVSGSPTALLSPTGTPDATDLGRLWNEGLAFYGWFFYLSKFYEVLDTVIILAKGKKSSTLQTYHHAGAMMSMWAGIRFMSPPIWMFVFVNSGIHTLMYTYYTLTIFAVPISQTLKRSLTTMQIIQFLVGVFYATLHSFISYTIPVPVSVTGAASTVSSAVVSATSAGVASLLKSYLSRATEEESLATNATGADEVALANPAGVQQQFAVEYQTVSCIDTSGQTFAIWLNVLYLTPLTVLFVRFFVRSYIKRTSGNGVVDKRIHQNGKANGAANGKANGAANGKANGAANGKANGFANGNANGVANGKANGIANGTANGTVNGSANGTMNGNANGKSQ